MNAHDPVPVQTYHQTSKHHPGRYAPGPGGLDWANQPDPFRTYAGAPGLDLPLGADTLAAPFEQVRCGERPAAAPVDLAHLALLLELSLGLSAWKSAGGARWALRCNPSSGNLHPTECYLVTAPRPGLAGGVWHYVSRDHRLEHRAADLAPGSPAADRDAVVLALTSIHWREAWKYGLRAYRYCQHDLGHALGALGYAAAALGWRVGLLPWGDDDLECLLGLGRADDFDPGQGETADLAVWVGPRAPTPAALERLTRAERRFQGRANRLSATVRDWPGIATAAAACQRPAGVLPGAAPHADGSTAEPPAPPPLLANPCGLRAADLLRQRRSALDFDGTTALPAARFFAILDALRPRPGVPPLDAWPGPPRVHLVLFVHRVTGVAPGLYLLARDPGAVADLRSALSPDWRQGWDWDPVPGAPAGLPLFLLAAGDVAGAAEDLACHQAIAADSAFSLAMLADFDRGLAVGPWRYRELFWECGLLGQTLYLEAEAAGVRGTGIGCFFDDAVHRLLGLADTRWQSLYHFTLGTPVDDPRLSSAPPYAHRA